MFAAVAFMDCACTGVGETIGESGRGVDVGERGLGGPFTIGMSGVELRLEGSASGWSADDTGAGDALEEVAGVD